MIGLLRVFGLVLAAQGAQRLRPRTTGQLLQEKSPSVFVYVAEWMDWKTDRTFIPHGLDAVMIGVFEPTGSGNTGIPKNYGGAELQILKKYAGANADVFLSLGGMNAVSPVGAKKHNIKPILDLYHRGFEFDGLDFDMEGPELGDHDFSLLQCLEVAKEVAEKIGTQLKVHFTIFGSQRLVYQPQFQQVMDSMEKDSEYKLGRKWPIQKRPSESTQNFYPHSFSPCPLYSCCLLVCED